MQRILFLLFFCLVFFACTKSDKDKESPVFQSLSVSPEKAGPGATFQVNYHITDNSALNQVRSRISRASAKSFGDWQIFYVTDISGLSYEGFFQFTIPDTARSGYYQIATQGVDMDGNATKDSLIYVIVSQPGFQPMLVNFATKPTMTDSVLHLASFDTLSFSGFAEDDIQLKKVEIKLENGDVLLKKLSYSISDSTNSWSFATGADSIFLDTVLTGTGSLYIKLQDSDGNQTPVTFPVVFQN